jgi:hypothetical protein
MGKSLNKIVFPIKGVYPEKRFREVTNLSARKTRYPESEIFRNSPRSPVIGSYEHFHFSGYGVNHPPETLPEDCSI